MYKSPRISHTHLQFAQAYTQPEIVKKYVLSSHKLTAKQGKKRLATKCIMQLGELQNSKIMHKFSNAKSLILLFEK